MQAYMPDMLGTTPATPERRTGAIGNKLQEMPERKGAAGRLGGRPLRTWRAGGR